MRGRSCFTYDVFDNLIVREIDADGDGMGASEILATLYDGNHPYADFDDQGNLLTRYIHGPAVDQILARVDDSGDVDWYLTDNLGSVRQIADTDGTILNEIDYDSFGNILNETTPSNGDRFKYTAREWEEAIDLYFYRARWYDAGVGRFVSEDPIEFESEDTNLYRYVGNDAANSRDPLGLRDWGGWVPGGYGTVLVGVWCGRPIVGTACTATEYFIIGVVDNNSSYPVTVEGDRDGPIWRGGGVVTVTVPPGGDTYGCWGEWREYELEDADEIIVSNNVPTYYDKDGLDQGLPPVLIAPGKEIDISNNELNVIDYKDGILIYDD